MKIYIFFFYIFLIFTQTDFFSSLTAIPLSPCDTHLRQFLDDIDMESEYRTHLLFEYRSKIGRAVSRLAQNVSHNSINTADHLWDVARVSLAFAWHLHSKGVVRFSEEDFNILYQAAILHDTGLADIPPEISRQGPAIAIISGFEADNLQRLKKSTLRTYLQIPVRKWIIWSKIRKIAMFHRELWNGQGPYKKKGLSVPLLARIIILADVWSLLRSDHSGNSLTTKGDAIEILLARIEAEHFDPWLSQHFIAFIGQKSADNLVASGDQHRVNQLLFTRTKELLLSGMVPPPDVLKGLPLYQDLTILEVLEQDGGYWSINGAIATLRHGNPSLGGGGNHQYMFEYRPKGSEPRLVKIMNIPTLAYLRQVHMANLGQGVRTPKLYRHGKTIFQGREYFYIDMAEQLREDGSIDLKSAIMDSGLKARFTSYIKNHPDLFLSQVVNNYISAIEQRTLPIDPDFIMNEHGIVRWFDTGDWQEVPYWSQEHTQKLNQVMGFFILYIQNIDPNTGYQIIPNLKREIISSERLEHWEKQNLLSNLISMRYY